MMNVKRWKLVEPTREEIMELRGDSKMILVLRVTGYYYDQLAKGTKNVEYRALTDYWLKRIKGPIDEIHFYRGYPKKGTKPLVRKVADIIFDGETKQIVFILEPIQPPARRGRSPSMP